uniref:Stress-response A/B barrel domain-containing protein n=1 Tax=Salix viminalis TaxID=40686 RepID=A0A6N2MTL2_SALVM
MASQIVKHIVLATFNDDITPEKIHELIDAYSSLRDQIQTIMSFSWGKDLGLEHGLNHGYTYAFESTFGSVDGLKDYIKSPVLAEFINDQFLPCTSQYLAMDYVLRNVQDEESAPVPYI